MIPDLSVCLRSFLRAPRILFLSHLAQLPVRDPHSPDPASIRFVFVKSHSACHTPAPFSTSLIKTPPPPTIVAFNDLSLLPISLFRLKTRTPGTSTLWLPILQVFPFPALLLRLIKPVQVAASGLPSRLPRSSPLSSYLSLLSLSSLSIPLISA